MAPVTSRLNSVQRPATSVQWFSAACKRQTRSSKFSIFRLRPNPNRDMNDIVTPQMDEPRFVGGAW